MTKKKPAPILLTEDIALDLSHEMRSRAVRTCAARLAERLGTTIDLVHVEDLYLYPVKTAYYQPIIERFFSDQKSRLGEIVKSIPVPSRVRFLHGDPVKKILALTSQRNAYEMVAVGTHGRKGLSRLLLGSIAEEVLRNSTLPVFTVGAMAQEHPQHFMSSSSVKIFVPTSLTLNTARAEKYAISLAKRLGAEVIYFHSLLETLHPVMQAALATPIGARDLAGFIEKLKMGAEKRLKAKTMAIRKNGVSSSFLLDVKELSAANAIIQASKSSSASLLIMGTHGRSMLSGVFLGRTARSVILQAEVPVITVRSRRS